MKYIKIVKNFNSENNINYMTKKAIIKKSIERKTIGRIVKGTNKTQLI